MKPVAATAASVACLFAGALAGEKGNAVPSPSVLSYLGMRARKMAAALPALPADMGAWKHRRDEVRKRLSEVLGLPEREPMKAETVKAWEKDGLAFEHAGADVVSDPEA